MGASFGIQIKRAIIGLEPDVIFTVFGFPITNSTLMMLLITVIFLIFFGILGRRLSIRPGKVQTVIELLYEQVVGLVDQITNDRKRSEEIFPMIAALITFLTVANLIGLIPGLTDITVGGKALFRPTTADFNTTFALALGAIIITQVVSIKEWGIFGHLGKFFKFKEVYQGFKKGIGAGFTSLVDFFVGLLDIIGEIAKVVSLALRLFGNMYAGTVLMIILFGAVAFVIPSVWLAMNIFVGILQAMVFAALVATYYMLAIKPDKEAKT